MKILVVEDSPIIRMAYVTLLRENDYDVDSLEDSKQALSMVKSYYDIILMDVVLFHLNGTDVAQQLRQKMKHKKLIIIGITSDTELNHHRMYNEILTKPVTLNQILQSIQKYDVYFEAKKQKLEASISVV